MLITAGCGISQITWPEWPTWPKYCKITHECDHINLGGPGSGNWYIMNSTMRSIAENENVDGVVVTWTNHDKLDLFLDDSNPIEDVRNFKSRNWILNWNGELTDDNSGFWPSSVSDDNYFKKSYIPWQNDINHALVTFQCILTLSQFCKQKNIPLYNFMSYDLEIEKFANNENTSWLVNSIDWNSWPTLEPLALDYYNSKWFDYEVTKTQGLIPVAGWHWEIYQKHFVPILNKHYKQKNINKEKLTKYVGELTRKKYNEYKNILEN